MSVSSKQQKNNNLIFKISKEPSFSTPSPRHTKLVTPTRQYVGYPTFCLVHFDLRVAKHLWTKSQKLTQFEDHMHNHQVVAKRNFFR